MRIYTQQEWEAETAKHKKIEETSDFDNACLRFRQICSEIGLLIGDENFKGGYDDMLTLYNHDAYKTDKGVQLAIAWSGCNELCKYEANNIGLGSPDWWFRCWSNVD